jgi:hypothetical protein
MAKALTCAFTFGVVVAASACAGDTPTQPSVNPRDRASVLRAPACATAQTSVRCTVATWFRGTGDTDVTTVVTWSVSDQPFSASATTIATVDSTGVVTPLRAGDIYIRVDHLGQWAVAPHSYRVNPNAPAAALARYVTGSVGAPGTASRYFFSEFLIAAVQTSNCSRVIGPYGCSRAS